MIYQKIFEQIVAHFWHRQNILILEIGIGKRGSSTKGFLQGIADRNKQSRGRLFSIEIDKQFEDNILNFTKQLEIEKNWTFIHGDSKKVKWTEPIDILFIDGDHSYEGVKADFNKYVPFVKDRGLILIHDVLHKKYGVRKFWKEIKLQKVFLRLDGAGLGIINKKV